MVSSDEDFLPDPERARRIKEPPDRREVSKRGKKRKCDDPNNQQSGLDLHDDFPKGKCFFLLCVTVSTCFHTVVLEKGKASTPMKAAGRA